MNVCMIAYTFYEGDNRVMRYAETLAARGDSVDVISLAHQGQQRVEILSSGVRVIRIQSRIKNERTKGAYLFRVMRFLVRALFVTSAQHLRSPYDFVHVHSVPDFLVFAAILPRLTGAKIVLDIHDLLPELYGSKFASQERSRVFALMKLIERVSSAFVDHVIAPNHIWQERLIGRSVPREKCSVFMNYPDPAVFRKRGRSRGDNRLVMIYPGTLNWHQGVDIAIRAFATVASRVPDSEFHIYGEGPSKLDLVRLTHELGLNGKVLFFDSVGLREIAGKIENADLGVVPKRNDPFGDEAFSTKTLEFMMLGVPLIVADTTVDRRYFNHDVVTFFKAGDACSLAEFMLRFFEDANLRSSQATRARIFVEAYSWETRKKEYLSLIDQLVGVTGAPGISHPKVASRVERGGMTRNRDGDVQVIAAVEPVAVERQIRESDISKHTSDLVKNSIQKVVRWVENHNYKAYDPGDGDLSFLRHFTFNTAFLRRALTAAILRTPFHIRPWVGIRPHTSTKGMGYMGWGYVKMYASGREEKYRRQADFCFDWLIEHRSPGEEQYCWGNHFSFSTRAGTIPRYTPTIVWSSLIGLAFLEAYEVLGNPRYLDVAESTAEWVKRLPREQTSRGTCLSYVPFRQVSIHNSNMLGAGLLARIGVCTNDREAVELAKDAMIYSCSRQNNDGAWFYGEDPHYHWIDSFHTGYNLDSLKRYLDTTGDSGFEQNFQRGIQYFKRNFFREDGSPKYYHDKAGPIDIQCAAQSIDSLAFLSDSDTESLELAAKIAHWTIDNMQAPDGHFYYRDLGWKKIKTPMLHWGQGTMFKALAHLLSKTTYRSIESSQEGLEIAASEAADLVD